MAKERTEQFLKHLFDYAWFFLLLQVHYRTRSKAFLDMFHNNAHSSEHPIRHIGNKQLKQQVIKHGFEVLHRQFWDLKSFVCAAFWYSRWYTGDIHQLLHHRGMRYVVRTGMLMLLFFDMFLHRKLAFKFLRMCIFRAQVQISLVRL